MTHIIFFNIIIINFKLLDFFICINSIYFNL